MEQYLSFKRMHPDKLVLFQVGDFYEVFFDDAPLAAREMEIALTSRDSNKKNAIPLAGIPIHAAETYFNKLLARGYKIAVCDQVEDAAQAKGLVRREITRILTPGTLTDPQMLEESRNNYLVAVSGGKNEGYGLAVVDVSTGDFRITQMTGERAWEDLADELRRLQPAECVCASPDLAEPLSPYLDRRNKKALETAVMPGNKETRALLQEQWGEDIWRRNSLERYSLAAASAALALNYLTRLQYPSKSKHFHDLELYFSGGGMIIDTVTARNLELTQTIREGEKQGSLLGLLDRCATGMGRRLLRRWLESPLQELDPIRERLDAVEELYCNPLQRREMRSLLQGMLDLERFCSRLSYRHINARDLVSLKTALEKLAPLKELLDGFKTNLLKQEAELPSFRELTEKIGRALVDEPPLSLRDGGLFRESYHPEVDRLKKLSHEGRSWLLEMEKRERERTGIKKLKVGYNRNFGYYLEVSRSNLDLVPPEYFRRQTLVNAERFVTQELKEMEEQITGARDRLVQLEYDLFEELRSSVGEYTGALQDAAVRLARLDCLQSLAEVAEINNYCRPHFSKDQKMSVIKGRHPVVEKLGDGFVPNDMEMGEDSNILIITGPNMAGKSTYVRSVALISLMAQTGSFVPAEKALLPVLDRIFARVGASDDLSRGYSTFMVEMRETAVILRDATPRSLLVLDEIGRGTSTYDGMSIARSVLEYISKSVKAKTLFSTHYHELTNLENEIPGVKNYTMAVKEKGKEVLFLRQVIPGRADKSYGINVARLAGIPLEVILRAEAILGELEAAAESEEHQLSLLPMVSSRREVDLPQLAVLEEIKELDLNRSTPLEALKRLFELQKRLLEEEDEG